VGREDFDIAYDLLDALNELKHVGIDGNLLTDLNDTGSIFDEIADHLDGIGKWSAMHESPV
jgi:hypothetical protein